MFNKYYKEVEGIEGWFSKDDAKIFYETICNLKGKGAMVEIGSWCGKSLIFSHLISTDRKNNCKKYSIDPFLTSKNTPNGKYQKFLENLKKYELEDKIFHIKEKSNDAGLNFKDDVEFIFLDGFHVYEYVKRDFELFSKKVILGGYILFHDISNWHGPTQLIYELSENSDNIKFLDFGGRTLLTQKVEKLSDEDKQKNIQIANLIREKVRLNNIKLKF